MRLRKESTVLTSLFLLLCLICCGTKGPPTLPGQEMPLRVSQLKAQWENNRVVLTGRVFQKDQGKWEIQGCRVFHVRYPLNSPPCEGCPLGYDDLREIRGPVISGGIFRCEIPLKPEKGIHFFQVRLMGSGGVSGPASDSTKVLVDNNNTE